MSTVYQSAGVDPEQTMINITKNRELLEQCKKLSSKIDQVIEKLQQRMEMSIQNQFDLNNNKIEIFDQIEKFFNQMLQKVEQRREKLKAQYTQIEIREKRRMKNKQMKLQKELDFLDEFKQDFKALSKEYKINQCPTTVKNLQANWIFTLTSNVMHIKMQIIVQHTNTRKHFSTG